MPVLRMLLISEVNEGHRAFGGLAKHFTVIIVPNIHDSK